MQGHNNSGRRFDRAIESSKGWVGDALCLRAGPGRIPQPIRGPIPGRAFARHPLRGPRVSVTPTLQTKSAHAIYSVAAPKLQTARRTHAGSANSTPPRARWTGAPHASGVSAILPDSGIWGIDGAEPAGGCNSSRKRPVCLEFLPAFLTGRSERLSGRLGGLKRI